MKAVKSITVDLTEANARYVIQALKEFEEKCARIAHDENASEDDHFFYANDLMQANLVLEKIQKLAVEGFGSKVLNFSHEVL